MGGQDTCVAGSERLPQLLAGSRAGSAVIGPRSISQESRLRSLYHLDNIVVDTPRYHKEVRPGPRQAVPVFRRRRYGHGRQPWDLPA